MLLELSGDLQTHDPTIIKENGKYYRIQTGPGIPLFVSDNLKEWKEYGHIFNDSPSWVKEKVPLAGKNDFWAPDCLFRKGSYRIYYSVSSFGKNTSAIGMCKLSTLDLKSKAFTIEDCGPVLCSGEKDDFNAIDAQVCSDGKGQDYLLFGSFWKGLQLVKLNEEGFVEDGADFIHIASRNLIPNSIEGGFIYRRNDMYFLFASHDFCCRGLESTYKIVVGASPSIEGPYYDGEGRPMLQGGGSLLRDGNSFSAFAGPGHNSIFEDEDGKTYIVYHAYDRQKGGRPALQIEEIKWKNDWPYLEE